jgi:hypothetical protein
MCELHSCSAVDIDDEDCETANLAAIKKRKLDQREEDGPPKGKVKRGRTLFTRDNILDLNVGGRRVTRAVARDFAIAPVN